MAIGDGPVVVRDIVQQFGGRHFRLAPGWIQRNGRMYEAAPALALFKYGPGRP